MSHTVTSGSTFVFTLGSKLTDTFISFNIQKVFGL